MNPLAIVTVAAFVFSAILGVIGLIPATWAFGAALGSVPSVVHLARELRDGSIE